MSLLRKKRIFYILLLFTVVLGVFALRMAWIQAASAFRAATVGGKTINEPSCGSGKKASNWTREEATSWIGTAFH